MFQIEEIPHSVLPSHFRMELFVIFESRNTYSIVLKQRHLTPLSINSEECVFVIQILLSEKSTDVLSQTSNNVSPTA